MATNNNNEAISNGNKYDENKLLATASEFGGNLSAGTAFRTGTPCPGIFLLDQSIRPTCAASAKEMSRAPHYCRANCICRTATSRLTSMITKTKSTMIPPT